MLRVIVGVLLENADSVQPSAQKMTESTAQRQTNLGIMTLV